MNNLKLENINSAELEKSLHQIFGEILTKLAKPKNTENEKIAIIRSVKSIFAIGFLIGKSSEKLADWLFKMAITENSKWVKL